MTLPHQPAPSGNARRSSAVDRPFRPGPLGCLVLTRIVHVLDWPSATCLFGTADGTYRSAGCFCSHPKLLRGYLSLPTLFPRIDVALHARKALNELSAHRHLAAPATKPLWSQRSNTFQTRRVLFIDGYFVPSDENQTFRFPRH